MAGKSLRETFSNLAETILRRREKDQTLSRLLFYSALENHRLSHRFFQSYVADYYELLADYIQQRIDQCEFRRIDAQLAGTRISWNGGLSLADTGVVWRGQISSVRRAPGRRKHDRYLAGGNVGKIVSYTVFQGLHMILRRWSTAGMLSLALLVITPFLLTSCTTQKTEAGNGSLASRVVPVTVATATRRDMPVMLTAIGNVSPVQTVQVKSMVTAEIMQVHFAVGQDVKKGQLLFTLDPRSFEATWPRPRDSLQETKPLQPTQGMDQKRYQSLLKEGVGSRQQYDEAR